MLADLEIAAVLPLLAGDGWRTGNKDLVAMLGRFERDRIEAQYAALEHVLAFVEEGRVVFPDDGAAQVQIAHDLIALGWHRARVAG